MPTNGMSASGGMLRIARQRKGFRQSEAAEKLGITRAVLSRSENGLTKPSREMVGKASELYGFPNSFFYQSDPVYGAPVSVHPMWRKKTSVKVREMDAITAELNIRTMHVRRLMDAVEIDDGLGVPCLDIEEYEDPEEVAGLVRRHWKVPEGPILNLTTLVEQAGVIVVHSTLGESDVSGVTFSVPGIPPLIVLNQRHPADRLRFTLAHELGHLVMHRFPTLEMDKEADVFAAALLMPADDIQPCFSRRKVNLALLASLKLEWRASMQSLLMRARSVAAVTQSQERQLWRQLSSRGMRLREPSDLEFPTEEPSTFASMLRIHINDLGYELGELESFLHMSAEEIPLFYGLDKTMSRVQSRRRQHLSLVKG